MGNIEICRLFLDKEISNALLDFRDYLFDQSINNEAILLDLAIKYSQSACFYSLQVDGKNAGIISLYVNDTSRRIGFISMIVLKSSFQGYGLGGILMSIAISCCKMNNLTKLQLEVNTSNERALGFYLKKGFKVCLRKSSTVILSLDL